MASQFAYPIAFPQQVYNYKHVGKPTSCMIRSPVNFRIPKYKASNTWLIDYLFKIAYCIAR